MKTCLKTFAVAAVMLCLCNTAPAQERVVIPPKTLERLTAITNRLREFKLMFRTNQLSKSATELDRILAGVSSALWSLPFSRSETTPEVLDHLLKVRLHVLQTIDQARDKNYDRATNRVTANVAVPLPANYTPTQVLASGMSPAGIADPKLRAEYEKAIAANEKAEAKLNRELVLERQFGFAVDQLQSFIKRYYPDAAARRRAGGIIETQALEAPLKQMILKAVAQAPSGGSR